jgi:hypothetical protein
MRIKKIIGSILLLVSLIPRLVIKFLTHHNMHAARSGDPYENVY